MNPQNRVAFVLRVAAPLLIVLSIWWPEVNHFSVDRAGPSNAVIENLLLDPSAKDLADTAAFDLKVSLEIPLDARKDAAVGILNGQLKAPSFLSTPYQLQGWPNDLAPGGPTFQLVMASLAVEDLLLHEFESGGDRRHYLLARDRIMAFAQWESQQQKPLAFLWNDHAIAARISVLIRLWRTLRQDSETTSAQRLELIALVQRSGELLAKKSQFTVRTNHGVMQNLALLQVSAAFPALPKAAFWRGLAMERLELQLGFYVSDEGIVLEHSAGYHAFGNELLAVALQLARLNLLEPSPRLIKAYEGTTSFLRHLKRPDESLPLVGNTAGSNYDLIGSESAEPLTMTSSYIYPLSGYAIWWSSGATTSQTFIAWAKHDRHGHKHADEPSVNFWSRGIDWITATGYWPYGARGYDQANSWMGSNAPHAEGEDMQSRRTVQLRASGQSGNFRAIDIENVRESGLFVRRQIIQLSPEQILVLDGVRGATSPIETLWTLDRRLNLEKLGAQRFKSSTTADGYFLAIELTGDSGGVMQNTIYKGNWSPFAGWVVIGREPTPAPGLLVERPIGNSQTVTLFTVGKQSEHRVINLSAGALPENWTIDIQTQTSVQRVQRSGDSIAVTNQFGTSSLKLAPPPPLALRQRDLRVAMSHALELYPPWRPLGFYHQRVYFAVAGLWVAVEVLLGFLARRRLRRGWMNAVVLAGWGSFGWWIHAIYLA